MEKLRKKFTSSKPDGFVIHEKESHVCRLKIAIYGLKQAPRAWYEKIDGYLMSLGFNKSVVDRNLYYNIVGDACLILVLYVDDLFLIGLLLVISLRYSEINSELNMGIPVRYIERKGVEIFL
jgi:hypothetical protein